MSILWRHTMTRTLTSAPLPGFALLLVGTASVLRDQRAPIVLCSRRGEGSRKVWIGWGASKSVSKHPNSSTKVHEGTKYLRR